MSVDERSESGQAGSHDDAISVSRRHFLRAIGAATIASVAATVTIPSDIAEAATRDKDDHNKARAILSSSDIYRQATKELRARGFRFKLDKSDFARNPDQPDIVAVVLH